MTRTLTVVFCAAAALALLPAQGAFAQAADQAKIQAAEKQPLGKYLTDAEGRSLYLFEADSENESACYDACAEAWPPLLTDGEPAAVEGADPSKLSTIERKDGATQVVYNGWPLYYFVKDQKPGDTTGQDVEGFGAEWYLVSPEGEKVHAEGGKPRS